MQVDVAHAAKLSDTFASQSYENPDNQKVDKPVDRPEIPVDQSDRPESKKRGKKTLVLKRKSLKRLRWYEEVVTETL
jgi:hypothetical protein